MRVGRHENIFILSLMAIKTAGSAQKVRFCRASENSYFLRLTSYRIISNVTKNQTKTNYEDEKYS